jgi:hypothetical protein
MQMRYTYLHVYVPYESVVETWRIKNVTKVQLIELISDKEYFVGTCLVEVTKTVNTMLYSH